MTPDVDALRWYQKCDLYIRAANGPCGNPAIVDLPRPQEYRTEHLCAGCARDRLTTNATLRVDLDREDRLLLDGLRKAADSEDEARLRKVVREELAGVLAAQGAKP